MNDHTLPDCPTCGTACTAIRYDADGGNVHRAYPCRHLVEPVITPDPRGGHRLTLEPVSDDRAGAPGRPAPGLG